jgi:hypothetical protein
MRLKSPYPNKKTQAAVSPRAQPRAAGGQILLKKGSLSAAGELDPLAAEACTVLSPERVIPLDMMHCNNNYCNAAFCANPYGKAQEMGIASGPDYSHQGR